MLICKHITQRVNAAIRDLKMMQSFRHTYLSLKNVLKFMNPFSFKNCCQKFQNLIQFIHYFCIKQNFETCIENAEETGEENKILEIILKI